MPSRADQIASWMRDQLSETSARGFVVGLSGGIDSAVVARLAQIAAGETAVTGVLMPCHSDPKDELDAGLVADHFKLRTVRIDLGPPYDALVSALRTAAAGLGPELTSDGTHDDIRARLPLANVKPRLRMATLYFVSNTQNYLVAGTGNRSELAIGYFTKYGDGGVDLLPIGRLLKEDVRATGARAGCAAGDHRQGTERGTLDRTDRRGRDGLLLRGAWPVPLVWCAVGPGAGRRAHRSAREGERAQAFSGADAGLLNSSSLCIQPSFPGRRP